MVPAEGEGHRGGGQAGLSCSERRGLRRTLRFVAGEDCCVTIAECPSIEILIICKKTHCSLFVQLCFEKVPDS